MNVATGQTWDEASSPAAVGLARQFEVAWRDSAGRRPDPDEYLQALDEDSPGARLAILRADLGLRWESGEEVKVEWYQDRYPDLSEETLVALIYEEFCLREEEYGSPDASEYYERFPSIAASLRRVLDIHGLVGSGATTTVHGVGPDPATSAFPEADQTIAGFHLVEELGRGAFARVFRAEERQLADRPVALKVARKGSREPQTLARLQHTHIVPVHSYRTDPATGLHLLCMPYFGRITLARLLEEPTVQNARFGSEVFETLEALDPSWTASRAGSRALASLTFGGLVAWWGARLAEALQHAHDRGVLHRDIKPSNVLVTSDGMPMLLDFNLAQTRLTETEDLEDEALGGTLAYMAPEHLEALAAGCPQQVDVRADIYALGVVLFEAMGTRPFASKPPAGSRSLVEALQRTADDRRHAIPQLRALHPEATPAFEAVVRKCLEPDPDQRYATASELAVDLQAVADGGPLRFAREPIPSRAWRWFHRNRVRLALSAPVIAGGLALGFAFFQTKVAEVRRRAEVQHSIDQGRNEELQGHYDLAASHFETAERLADPLDDRPAPMPLALPNRSMADLKHEAHTRFSQMREAMQVRADAAHLFRASGKLRFDLLGFGGTGRPDSQALEKTLAPFFVMVHENWTERPELLFLDPSQRARLIGEVEELLFFWALASSTQARAENEEPLRQAVRICDKALTFSPSKRAWMALKDRCQRRLEGWPTGDLSAPSPQSLNSAWAAFQWGLIRLSDSGEHLDKAIAWLERSVQLDPARYWTQYYLAYCHEKIGLSEQALACCNTAIALDKYSPWAHFSRAHLLWQRGAWQQALDSLDLSIQLAAEQGQPFVEAYLERGFVRLRLGDVLDARADLETALAVAGPSSAFGRAARVNLAMLDYEAGRVDRARQAYDALLNEDPSDVLDPGGEGASALLGRAQLSLWTGQLSAAETDLNWLLTSDQSNAEVFALRARARLAMDRPSEAVDDARSALRFDRMPSRERLLLRARLAAGDVEGLDLDRPSALWELPGPRSALRADLRRAERLLAQRPDDPSAQLNRAVILAALGDRSARRVADEAVTEASGSIRSLLLRARLRRWLGDRSGALADLEAAGKIEPEDRRVLELAGRLECDVHRTIEANALFDRVVSLGGTPTVHRYRADLLLEMGRPRDAVAAWSSQLELDPDDPEAYLGRARSFARLRQWDQAIADLEQAAAEAPDRPALLVRILLVYAECLPERLDRLPRVISLLQRAGASAIHARAWLKERPE